MAGIVSHRRIVTRGEPARLGAFVIAIAAATALTLLNNTAQRPVAADGNAIFPFGPSLLLLAFLGGYYWRSLASQRWLMPAAVVWNIVLGLLLYPDPSAVTMQAMVASLIYSLFPFFPCLHLAGALERARSRHAVSVRTVDEGAEQTAFLEGRESVVGLVRRAGDDAARQLQLLTPRLHPGVAELAADRLREVERRLASSLSTTTG